MKRLLHIIATPREEASRTLQISHVFLDTFKTVHPNWVVDELDLDKENLPPLNMKSVSGKYILLQGSNLFGKAQELWAEILQHIERFKTADLFLISTPMWNFHIPYLLKQYIDLIVQPKYLFQYKKEGGAEGLVLNKKMVIITTRGGNYGGELKNLDFQEPYLKAIFNFIGITDISFINAEPTDMGLEKQKKQIAIAQQAAKELGVTVMEL